MNTPFHLLCAVMASLIAAGSSHAATRYVKSTATGASNGTSWANAYTRLQDALAVAASGDQIWIASGTYKPSTTGVRTQSFNVPSGVGLYGGFVGTEATLADRTSAVAATILSGDLLGNDNGNRARTEATRLDNTYNVVRVSAASATVTFDGLTIQSGHSETYGDSYDGGAGIHFLASTAGNVVITNCIIRWNTARSSSGWFDDSNHAFIVTATQLVENQAERGGAAGFGGSFTIQNSAFIGNRTENSRDGYQWGGGLFIANGTGQVINCVFESNYAAEEGGAVYNHGNASFINCTFVGNSAVRWSSALHDRTNSASVRNCIFWGNTGTTYPISADGGSPGTPVFNSLVQGGYTAGGAASIISSDPLFTNNTTPLGADGKLGTADDGLRLGPGSPAINAGNNAYVPVVTTTDIGGALRISGTVDMGAYETLPVITTQPLSITVVQNAVASFSVTATGTGTLSYQWQKDGVDIPGANSNTYSLASAKPWQIGDYTVQVTDSNGTVTSNAATLSLTGINGGLWRGLIGYYELDGSASDLSPFSRSGVNNGVTPTTDRFGNSGLASYFNGSSFMSVASSPVTGKSPFTVSFWASVESQTTGSEGWQVAFGQPNGNQAFHIGNRGYGATNIYGGFWSNTTSSNTPLVNFNYSQFFHFVAVFDGVKVSVFKNGLFIGSSTNDLSGVNIQAGSMNFGKQLGSFNEYFKGTLDSVRIYNRPLDPSEIKSLYSSEASIQIATHPQSVVLAQNAVASFSVTATGTGTLSYQWQKDGVDIPGATGSSFTLASAKPWHIGDYTVKITDSNGTVTSNAATLSLVGINSGIWRGVVAYYPFKNTTTDTTFFMNNGTAEGVFFSPDRFGFAQSACSVTNIAGTSNRIRCGSPQNGIFDLQGDTTITIWLKAASSIKPADGESINGFIAKDEGPGFTNKWILSVYPDRVGVYIRHSDQDAFIYSDSTGIMVDKWRHVTISKIGNKFYFYVDGLSKGSSTHPVALPLVNSEMTLGWAESPFETNYSGDMDDVRIYNRAMSASEVSALYAAENAPNNWRQTHFGSTANTGNAADGADPDGDGLKNLLEYALNLPPNAASRVPAAVQAAGGNLEYTYTRGTAAYNGGTTFQVEWSDDLTTWFTTGVVESLISDDGTHQQVKATLPAGSAGRRFVRLRVQ